LAKSQADERYALSAGSRRRTFARGRRVRNRRRAEPDAPYGPPQRPGLAAGAFAFVLKEAFMFEEQPQPEIDALIKSNPEFKQLYQRHKDLDKKVMDAELGVLPIDDTTLGQMKREKLAAKDRLIQLYDQQH
jgi:uncharacterized protein YdcH (DUF465 family)